MDLSVGLGVFATPDEGDWLEDLQDTSTKSGSIPIKVKRKMAFFIFKDPPSDMNVINKSSSHYCHGRN